MYFNRIVLENFGAFKGSNSINLAVEENKPIILLGGMNGAGKTTLFKAINIALYGHRYIDPDRGRMGYAAYLKEFINTSTTLDEQTSVELELALVIDDEWQTLRVCRTWNHQTSYRDYLSVSLNGSEDSFYTSDWDSKIEALLPMGISSLFLFDGEQVRQLADLESPPPVLVKSIRSLFGLDIADQLEVDLKTLKRRWKKQLEGSYLHNFEIEQPKYRAQFLKVNAEKRELEYQLQDAGILIRECQQALEIANINFLQRGGELSGRKFQLQAEYESLGLQIDEIKAELRELATGILPLALVMRLCQQTQSQASLECQGNNSSTILKFFESWCTEFRWQLDLMSLPEEDNESIQCLLDEKLEELSSPMTQNYLGADSSATAALTHTLQELLNIQGKAKKLVAALTKATAAHIALETQLSSIVSPEEYEHLKSAVALAQERLMKEQSHSSVIESEIKRKDQEISRLSKEWDAIANGYLEVRDVKHKIDHSPKTLETLQEFQKRILRKYVTKLEQEVTSCFKYLLHKDELVHRVAIDADTFALSIWDAQSNCIPKARLSAGEQQILSTSFLWGVARIAQGKSLSIPVVIDTPLGRLDSEHREMILTKYFPGASHQLIVFSTDTEIDAAAVNKLRELDAISHEYLLVNESNQSKVKEGYFFHAATC